MDLQKNWFTTICNAYKNYSLHCLLIYSFFTYRSWCSIVLWMYWLLMRCSSNNCPCSWEGISMIFHLYPSVSVYLSTCISCHSLSCASTCCLCIAVGVPIQWLLQECWRWGFATCLSIRAGNGIWRMRRIHMRSFKGRWRNLWWFLQMMPVSYCRMTGIEQLYASNQCLFMHSL